MTHPDTTRLQQAVWRLEDILKDDDGQAWKEASKFLERLKKEQREEANPAAPVEEGELYCTGCGGIGQIDRVVGAPPADVAPVVLPEPVAAGKIISAPQGLRECCEHLNAAGHAFWAACALEADGGAVRWVKYADGSLIVFTRGEYKDQILSALGGLYSAPTKVFEHHSEEFERETQAFEATDKQRVDALDAKRYRLLRDEWLDNEPEAINMERARGQRGLDAAIDAAIALLAKEQP